MKESAKWRSGRDRERTVRTRPSGRGGKSADAFSDHEGVAAQDNGKVMVPARKGTALEVIEPEFSFEILVHALGSPALLEHADDLLLAQAPGQRREDEFGRFLFIFGPLGDEPERLAIGKSDAVVVRSLDADETEARTQFAFAAIAPDEPTKCFLRQRRQELLDRFGLGVDAIGAIESHDPECRQYADGEVEAESADCVAKIGTVTVGAVGQDHVAGDAVPRRPAVVSDQG